MYELKVIAFLKSGMRREGQTKEVTREVAEKLNEILTELGSSEVNTLVLNITDDITEYIPAREIEFISVVKKAKE